LHADTKLEEIYSDIIKQTAARAWVSEITQNRHLLTTLPFSPHCLKAKHERAHPFKAMVSSKRCPCPSPIARWLHFLKKRKWDICT